MTGGPGGFDIMGIMQQAQKQAEAMKQKIDSELAEKTVEGATGGGMVKVVLTGAMEVRKVTIDQSLCDPSEKDMLEDLVAAALNVAVKKAKQLQDDAQAGQVGNMLGGMGGGGGMPDLGALFGGLGGGS